MLSYERLRRYILRENPEDEAREKIPFIKPILEEMPGIDICETVDAVAGIMAEAKGKISPLEAFRRIIRKVPENMQQQILDKYTRRPEEDAVKAALPFLTPAEDGIWVDEERTQLELEKAMLDKQFYDALTLQSEKNILNVHEFTRYGLAWKPEKLRNLMRVRRIIGLLADSCSFIQFYEFLEVHHCAPGALCYFDADSLMALDGKVLELFRELFNICDDVTVVPSAEGGPTRFSFSINDIWEETRPATREEIEDYYGRNMDEYWDYDEEEDEDEDEDDEMIQKTIDEILGRGFGGKEEAV